MRPVQLPGVGWALIDVDVLDGDAGVGAGGGDVDVLAEEFSDIAVGLLAVGIVGLFREGDDDADGLVELVEVGEGLGGEGVLAETGKIEPPAVVKSEVVEPAEEAEEEEGLQHEVDRAEPAGGAEAGGKGHPW